MHRQCSEVVDNHQVPRVVSSLYHFAGPEASNCQDLLGGLLSHRGNSTETSDFRGDVPKKGRGPLIPGFDDSGKLHESTVGSQGYHTGSTADYSSHSFRSRIATFSSGISDAYTKPAGLQRAQFKGRDDEADHKLALGKHLEPSLESPNTGYNAQTAVYRNQVTSHTSNGQWKAYLQVPKQDKVIKADENAERKTAYYYKKATYTVLIGDTVRVCSTKLYATLPLHNKCMVKERIKDALGNTRVKLSLRTFNRLVLFLKP